MLIRDMSTGDRFMLAGSTYCGIVLEHSVGGTTVRYEKRVEDRPNDEREAVKGYAWQISGGTEVRARTEASMAADKIRSAELLKEWRERQEEEDDPVQ